MAGGDVAQGAGLASDAADPRAAEVVNDAAGEGGVDIVPHLAQGGRRRVCIRWLLLRWWQ